MASYPAAFATSLIALRVAIYYVPFMFQKSQEIIIPAREQR